MEEKKQTAVEWLINQLLKVDISDPHILPILEKQAKEMEQDQLDKAYRDGLEYANKYLARLP